MSQILNGYIAIYKGKQIEVYSDSIYNAQEEAKNIFKNGSRRKVNGWDIAIALCEKNGKQVTHNTSSI